MFSYFEHMATLSNEFSDFLQRHEPQLINIPHIFWKPLYIKLKNEIFDAGNHFTLMKDEGYEWHVVVTAENGLKGDDGNNIFLIDHAWTYEANYAKYPEEQLRHHPTLRNRMGSLMNVSDNDQELEIKAILSSMWSYNRTYFTKYAALVDGLLDYEKVSDDRNYIPLWYVMDEFGSKIQHSDKANFNFKPFLYVDNGIAFTVFYPTENIEHGDEVFRDYIPEVEDALTRDARLYPWKPERLNLNNITDNLLMEMFENKSSVLSTIQNKQNNETTKVVDDKRIFKVYSDHSFIDTLTDDHFTITENEEEAKILFFVNKKHNESYIAENNILLHFSEIPNEKVLVFKDLFAVTSIRSLVYKYGNISQVPSDLVVNRGPAWLPTTFNLNLELPQFIKYFKEQETRGVSNLWIIKPCNLARSLDHTITDNLNHIIRLVDTGPKIACRYIEEPVLFYRDDVKAYVKQEFRFHVIVKSVEPFQVYLHDLFLVRFANKAYELNDFSEYQKHFSNNYYRDDCPFFRMTAENFLLQFKEQYPSHEWKDILELIKIALREFMISATSELPPNGLGRNKKCYALYGFDVILKWADKEHTRMQPMLLESNFHPDITRCTEDKPSFMDEIFQLLFLNRENDAIATL